MMASDRDLTSPWAHSMGPSVAPILAWPVIRNPLFPRTSHPRDIMHSRLPRALASPLPLSVLSSGFISCDPPIHPPGPPPPSEPRAPLCVYPLAMMHLLCEGCFLLSQGLLTSSGWGNPADLSSPVGCSHTISSEV